jgi:hypothetical protein
LSAQLPSQDQNNYDSRSINNFCTINNISAYAKFEEESGLFGKIRADLRLTMVAKSKRSAASLRSAY